MHAPETARLQVVLGGLEQCASDYECKRDSFSLYAVEMVVAGHGRLTLAGRPYGLEAGSVFAYGPGIPHRIVNAGDAVLTKYHIAFRGTDAGCGLETARLRPGAVARCRNPALVRDAFEFVVLNGCSKGMHAPQACAHALRALCHVLSDHLIPHVDIASKALRTFERVKDMIDRDAWGRHGLDHIARRNDITPAYLCRLFRRFEHKTVHQYVLLARMTQAADMLRQERLLVKEVAARLDYPDAYQFSRAFKRTFGLAPQQYSRLFGREMPSGR